MEEKEISWCKTQRWVKGKEGKGEIYSFKHKKSG